MSTFDQPLLPRALPTPMILQILSWVLITGCSVYKTHYVANTSVYERIVGSLLNQGAVVGVAILDTPQLFN